jgi:hypothetical protein
MGTAESPLAATERTVVSLLVHRTGHRNRWFTLSNTCACPQTVRPIGMGDFGMMSRTSSCQS